MLGNLDHSKGSPPQKLEVFMDTGSDLVWVPCIENFSKPSFECIMCENLDIPTFSAFQSHSSKHEFCSSDSCSAIHNSDNPKDICTVAGCPFESIDMEPCLDPYPTFYYAYGDGSLRCELMRNKLKWKNISKILSKYQLNQEFFGFILLSLKRESRGNIEKLPLTS